MNITNLLQLNKRLKIRNFSRKLKRHFQTDQTNPILTYWYEDMAICYHINICLYKTSLDNLLFSNESVAFVYRESRCSQHSKVAKTLYIKAIYFNVSP